MATEASQYHEQQMYNQQQFQQIMQQHLSQQQQRTQQQQVDLAASIASAESKKLLLNGLVNPGTPGGHPVIQVIISELSR